MRQLLAAIILCFVTVSSSYGQSTDTTKTVRIRIDCSPKILRLDQQPLYVFTYKEEKIVTHKEVESVLEHIGTGKFSSVKLMEKEEANTIYGEAARNGVILIGLDEKLVKRKAWNRLKLGWLD